MTTTGDLFVNIKGNNSGLRKSLNQSSRDIGRFSSEAQQKMKSGVGGADVLGIAALTNAKTIFNGLAAMNARRKRTKFEIQGQRIGQQFTIHENRRNPMGPFTLADTERRKKARTHHASVRAKAKRNRLEALSVAPTVKALLSAPAVIGAVAGIAGLVIARNWKKWADRTREASMKYSAPVMRNAAMLEIANTRRDIKLAKDPTVIASQIAAQKAADFRKNSGSMTPTQGTDIGSAWDVGVGAAAWAGNYLVSGQVAGMAYRYLTTEGGVK